MKKIALALALSLGIAVPAHAMPYFLVAHWFEAGKHFCKYGNGSVLVVIGACPVSVEG